MLTLNVPDEGYTRNELCVLNCISPSLFKLFVVALHVQKEAKKHLAFMVLHTTFNNISVIAWRSVALVEKAIDMPRVTDKLYYIKLYRVYLV